MLKKISLKRIERDAACTLCRGRTAGVPPCSQCHVIYRFRVSVRQVLTVLVLPTACYGPIRLPVDQIYFLRANNSPVNHTWPRYGIIIKRPQIEHGVGLDQCLDYHHHWHTGSEWEAGIPTARSPVDDAVSKLNR